MGTSGAMEPSIFGNFRREDSTRFTKCTWQNSPTVWRVWYTARSRMAKSTVLIILNWNGRDMTAECIRSVLAMRGVEYKVVIVDNGSHDGSVEFFKKEFPQCIVLPQSHNLGFPGGCNVGIKDALRRGAEYVVPLNNDTIVDPDFLQELVRVAEQNTEAAIVSPKIYFYDSPDRFWWAGGSYSLWSGIPVHMGRKEKDTGQFDRERALDWATGCAMLIRASALREVGLFDERFFLNAEDLDLSVRIRRAGYQICYAPKAKLWHKEGVDRRNNGVNHLNAFSGARNLLWIMHKHASLWQWVTFWPNFLLRYGGFYVVRSIFHRDFRSAWAILSGIAAFLTNRSNPGSSPVSAVATPSAEERLSSEPAELGNN
jgi:GT2 family glycosyltransferase